MDSEHHSLSSANLGGDGAPKMVLLERKEDYHCDRGLAPKNL